MASKVWRSVDGPLSEVLPDAVFGEHHTGLAMAPAAQVWEILMSLSWSELRFTKFLMILRGLGGSDRLDRPWPDLFAPWAVFEEDPPRSVAFAMVARPWERVPRPKQMATMCEVRDFQEPGWLKYGMEWTLTEPSGGRTRLETRTLCEPTDRSARLAFGFYWSLIRPGSAAIRKEILAAVRSRCAAKEHF